MPILRYPLPAGSNFCPGCGTATNGDATYAAAAQQALARMTPRHLAEQILRARAELRDARRLVTVLFVDIVQSSAWIASEDPESAGARIDTVIQTMVDCIHRYEGTVTQVLGDGLMALFGAPLAHEDHALRAACAALDIHRDLAALARASAGQSFEALARVGLNSGEVLIRAIGNDLSIDYRAVGPTTYVAARMEQIAPAEVPCSPLQRSKWLPGCWR
ncbi:MAG: adenylate/guanylate cyclase domain-containing protein [Burkholderiaceae bacterium]